MVKEFLTKNKQKIAWSFLIASVLLSVFIRFPTGFYDEQVHYIRAKGIANGQLLSYPKDSSNGALGHDVDQAGLDYVNHYYLGDRSEPVSVGWLKDEVGKKAISDERTYVLNTSAAPYTPVPYLPFALASKVSQTMNFSVKSEFLTMRLFGAFAALLIVFAAFKVSPTRYRWMVMAVALVPMSVAAFAAISIDGYTISTALLFVVSIARVASLANSRKLATRDIAMLAISSLLLVFAKMPAFLMIALVLGVILVFRKNISKKHIIYMLSVIGVTAIITLLWVMYAKGINTGAYWGRDVDTLRQLSFIASEPLLFLANLTHSMISYDYTNVMYTMHYVNHVRYSSLPPIVDIIIYTGIFLSAFIYGKQTRPSKEQKLLYWLQVALFIAISVAIFMLLYLQFTPVGTSGHIDGVQPRYFLPFIPLLAIAPYRFILSAGWRRFTYVAPFIGIMFYVGFLVLQLV